jgi:hypothetical protein
MENESNIGCSVDKRSHACGYEMLPYSQLNPEYVLSSASLIFGSGDVDFTNVVRADLLSSPEHGWATPATKQSALEKLK